MPRRVLIAIGIDNAEGLTPLNAAASGAKQLAAWAKSRGVEVAVFTDEAGPVTRREIFKAVKAYVESQTVEHLCIYFAGHGFMHGYTNEVWCLSDAAEDPGESIDINSSVAIARMSGIPHVVFISDACRVPAKHLNLFSTGSPIFPPAGNQSDVEVDEFYATKFGDAALEESPTIAQDCNGVFTKELVKAITDPVSAGLKLDEIEGSEVFTSREVKTYLDKAVPLAAEALGIQYKQIPDLRVNTVLPKYLGPVKKAEPVEVIAATEEDEELMLLEEAQNLLQEEEEKPKRPSVLLPKSVVRRMSNAKNDQIYSAQLSKPNPTGFQFKFRDEKLKNAGSTDQTVRMKEADHGVFLGVPEYNPSFPVLVETDAGLVPLIKIPRYNALISTFEEEVSGYWYEPEDEAYRQALAYDGVRIRKEVYTRLQENTLTSLFLEEKLGDRIRQFKAFDPMLGVIASYIYAERGLREKVASVRSYMRRDIPEFEIQDIWMLSHLVSASEEADWPTLSPFPLLTRGWAYLKQLPQYDSVSWMEPALNPGIWTSFDPERLARFKPAHVKRWW